MGKWMCPCAKYVFSDTTMPMDFAWCLIPQKTVWDDMTNEDEIQEVAMNCEEIWECPICKGISRFDSNGDLISYYCISD